MNDKENECPECLEQARLLGIGAEREADLLGKLERERALFKIQEDQLNQVRLRLTNECALSDRLAGDLNDLWHNYIQKVSVDFSRRLERERDDERALADRLGEALEQVMRDEQDLTYRRGWIDFSLSNAALAAWKEARSE